MALLATQRVVQAGLTPSFAAATAGAGGDTFVPGDDVYLHVKTGGTGATVTVVGKKACDQGVVHDLTRVIGTNTEALIGPLPAVRFADPTTGLAKATFSQVTSVTVAAIAN